ncbi:hypothetical protein ACSFC1_00680 [Pseudothermotoga sp. U03pept]|uniref:hypothetical protein n=1 Tax=Pseudothermotoga sp. U03pept TaxID=3447012 RepID=UPI003F00ED1C
MVYGISWLSDVQKQIEPYYAKCAVFKALDWVDGEIPGTVTVAQHKGTLVIKAIPVKGSPKTISLETNSQVKVKAKDYPTIVTSPNGVLRAGTVETADWTMTFPPVVTKINIKR